MSDVKFFHLFRSPRSKSSKHKLEGKALQEKVEQFRYGFWLGPKICPHGRKGGRSVVRACDHSLSFSCPLVFSPLRSSPASSSFSLSFLSSFLASPELSSLLVHFLFPSPCSLFLVLHCVNEAKNIVRLCVGVFGGARSFPFA